MGRNERGRKIFLATHRIIGLFAGAILVLIGLSGSVLAFREDIDEWLNAPLMRVEAPARPSLRPLDEILAAATAAMPADGRPERLALPRHAHAAAIVSYMVETDDLDTYFHQLFVDPYTAKVTGSRLYSHGDDVLSQPLVQIVMAFHWTLLLGVNNAYLVGAIGLLLFLSILVGLCLWRPRYGDWRLGLTIKWGASPERIAYDAHRSVGVYFALLLLATLATGVAMIFKPATHSLAALLSPVRPSPIMENRRRSPDSRRSAWTPPSRSRIKSSPPGGCIGYSCRAARMASMSSASNRMTSPTGPRHSAISASIATAAACCRCRTGTISPRASEFWNGCFRCIAARPSARSAARSFC